MTTRCKNSDYTVAAKRPGFTLIELLVVISIIALLLSILLPGFRNARDAVNRTHCMANLHAIGVSLMMYANDHHEQLPGYNTIGKHAFRIQTGSQLSLPVPGSKIRSPFPEAWGLQAVLQTGSSPRILPNGVAIGEDFTQPKYFPADSKAWLCPGNPGPSDRDDWEDWGNTYSYRCNSGGGDPQKLKKIYNLDYLALNKGGTNSPLIWDNFNLYPGDPGFNGPFERYTVDAKFQQPPHRSMGVQGGPTQLWIAFYVDGHCQMNGLNK